MNYQFLVALLACVIAVAPTVRSYAAAEAVNPPLTDAGIAKAWRTLRAVDCARCHSKDYDGLAAPSIIKYVATQNREMFTRIVLDGNPQRGMPGYSGNPLVVEDIDSIYRYFTGRADGSIAPGSRPIAP